MSIQIWDSCWIYARLVTCCLKKNITVMENAVIGIKDRKICWIGSASALPDAPEKLARIVHSASHQ